MSTPETAQQRRTRWRHDEQAARRTPGHVFSVCGNCGESWMSADPPEVCRRCESDDVGTSHRCRGCNECADLVSRPGEQR